RASTREERTSLFKDLYGELFERVPDHPRLTRRETPESSRKNVEKQLRLIRPYLTSDSTLLEVAPGDCRLGHAAAGICAKVIGVDISDQRAAGEVSPPNFSLVVYDGYHLDLPDGCADVAFSYQFLEHLHPDDVDPHFEMIRRLLKPGGVYIFDSPHRFSGPHDVSSAFGDELQCFHFQEWTYRGMRKLLRRHGFGESRMFRRGSERRSAVVNQLHDGVEGLVGMLPGGLRKVISKKLFQAVTLAAVKD
ncbi:MAG: class I SAM-dependent methyltransferase, partial [Verrucomicrobiae bacterium]|nr:class I SAM-dependent methyltransferase [Verrucomicrobiae bacterium]